MTIRALANHFISDRHRLVFNENADPIIALPPRAPGTGEISFSEMLGGVVGRVTQPGVAPRAHAPAFTDLGEGDEPSTS